MPYRLHYLLFFALFPVSLLVSGCNQNGKIVDLPTGHKSGQPAIAIISLDNTTLSAARALNTAFAKAAPRYGLTLRKGQAGQAQFYLKGYFSLLTDENPDDALILYVFDILNPSGLRLRRIKGNYPLRLPPATAPEQFWDFVSPDGYAAIAGTVLSQAGK